MTTTTIELTEQAKDQLKALEVNKENFLRLWVEAGGCSGMSYQAAIDDAATPFDEVLYEDSEIKVISDKTSAGYLDGLKIDYTDDLVRSGFKVENPNAVKTCGCGNSFET